MKSTVLQLGVLAGTLVTATIALNGQANSSASSTDLDVFMSRVLERRDDNWKKLQQYVLEEREVFQLIGPGATPLYGMRRESAWFPRDGTFVKSPLRVNGVTITEEDRRKADPGYKKQSAGFWLFYLIQNDDAIGQINLAHDASPSFEGDAVPLNDEAKLIRKAGDPFVSSEKTRLFEIGRAWDAFAQGKDVLIQLFKNPNAMEDRRFLWDMYFTLMHEYLHKLAHKHYDEYAEKLGGEKSTEGNTLIEGVDSLLTEITWSSAVGRASLPAVRGIVEPDAVKAKLPFDPDLLPTMPHRRYDTYEQATRLVSVVGIRNLYAAYFQGKVALIGGP